MLLSLPASQPAAQKRPARIRKMSASQQIYQALRERIIELELPPGESLSRLEVAAYYGVSQTPVRDAMMRLEEDGLLDIFPQSKTEVSRINVAQARETQFLRMALEIEVSRRLCSSDLAEDLSEAEQAITKQAQALEANDLASFSAHDRNFHTALFVAAGVPDLWDLVTARSGHIDRLRKLNLPDPGKATEIIGYHRRILQTIKDKNPSAAEAELRGHLTGTLSSVDAIMQRHPEFFDPTSDDQEHEYR